ncbi:flagellar export protein FliJ [Camelimonas abortus]|uniref:Flagellar export protein FliJ n=1 Tax=Camelimonas abortus TaxID=1017184 RepID=A0ABV7LEB9_9HYPH
MKSRDTLLRLKRFQADGKRRRVQQIEMMTAEFERMAAELEREIALEEARTGIADPAHFAYSTYAAAARTRRDNLLRSAAGLRDQLDVARAELEAALEELKAVESLGDRERVAEEWRPPARASRAGA